jgi:predicted nucleic acid-binding Zn ribbon protein
VSRRDDQPAELAELLDTLAGRLRRVDLRLIDRARELWPTVVQGPLGEHCRVELIKDGVLIISVPSGAFAEQIRSKSPTILRGFSTLGKGAPTSLRTVVK